MLATETRTALLAALARLRDDDRLVLGCRYLLELSRGRDRGRARRQAGHRQVAHLARPRAPARGGDAVNDLETALRELDVEWPATPDLATAVMARIAVEAARPAGCARRRRRPAPRGWRARLAYLAAALVLLGGGTLAASPAARSTVLEWLGLKSVKIERTRAADRRARSTSARAIALPEGHARPGGARRPRGATTRRCPTARSVVSLVYEGPILVPGLHRRAVDAVHPEDGRAWARALERVPGRLLDHRLARLRVRVGERRRLRGAAARRPDAADRARRAADPRRGRDLKAATARDRRSRSDLSNSVTGPAASSPAARSGGPCGAAPPPTARSGSSVKISSRVGGSMIHASSASSSSS